LNTKLVEKNLTKKVSKDFPEISVKNEDWKYVGKNIYTVKDFEVGKPVKIIENKNFNVDTNCFEFLINKEEKNVEITDIEKVKKSIIDESIKRPFDKFSIEQFEKLTGGIQLNIKEDFSDYYSINFQSEDTSVPYLGVNVEKNKSGRLLFNFGELVKGDIFPTIELFLEQNASLEIIINVTSKNEISLINNLYAKLLNDANLSVHMVSTGGLFSRSRLDIDLFGNGSGFEIDGVYFGENNQIHDTRVFVNHLGKSTTSNMITKGVLGDESSSIFTGTIHIAEGAVKTESQQENRNIILTEKASAQSVPNLEILCDDVICGHGSSVGPIDETLYHYVMSRGINKEDAEKLLIKGFFNEVINEDAWDIIHDEVADTLTQKYENILERKSNEG
tara:strand:+ start:673 stop:1842 length:1170 start_codon:yes stop_codon:yes gene_type:complete